MPEVEVTHVIHAATDTLGELSANPLLHFDSIVTGTRLMLDLATQKRAGGFLMLSSGAVYRPIRSPAGAFETDTELGGPDPTNPLSAYSEGKRAAELQCALYTASGRVPTQIARLFGVVGPFLELDAHFAIGNFIRDAISGRDIVVRGDGSPLRSYLYGGDIVGWLLTIMARGRPGEAYNVGSDWKVSVRDLAECVRDTVAPRARVVVETQPAPKRPGDIYVPDVTRARQELGLSVRRELPDAVAATALWARQEVA
jgi:dTDP-glucose 4,6-dehydratase